MGKDEISFATSEGTPWAIEKLGKRGFSLYSSLPVSERKLFKYRGRMVDDIGPLVVLPPSDEVGGSTSDLIGRW